jgi:chromosomal replication initiation ATPase DnaA
MITIRHCRKSQTESYKPKFEWPIIKEVKPEPKPEVKVAPKIISDKGNALIEQVMKQYGVTREQLFSSSRVKPIITARRHLMSLMHDKLNWNASRIAHFMDIDRTTVCHHIGLRRSSVVKYGSFKMP